MVATPLKLEPPGEPGEKGPVGASLHWAGAKRSCGGAGNSFLPAPSSPGALCEPNHSSWLLMEFSAQGRAEGAGCWRLPAYSGSRVGVGASAPPPPASG